MSVECDPDRCAACHETIRVGDRYAYSFAVWQGQTYETRRCLRCQAIHLHLREKCRDERDAEEWPDDALNCGHDYLENWGHEPPPEIAALAFALPDEMQAKAKL